MKRRIRKRLVGILCLSLLITIRSGTIYAGEPYPVIDLGTFEMQVSGNSSSGGGSESGNDTGSESDNDSGEKKETHDISNARVYYTVDTRYRNKPVEFNIFCVIDTTTWKYIPEDCYTVTYMNNDRPGAATAIITGKNGYTGEQRIPYTITGVYVAQAPADSDILTEYRTVVATGTKWRITPSFNIVRVRSTDGKIIGVSRKADKSKSSGKNKWYYAYIQAKKPGLERVILDGVNGERASYLIYAENPKIIKNSLKFNDVKTVSMNEYITGVTYLLPFSVTSKNTKVATVSGDNSISVSANGSSRITLVYGKRKINTTLTAKLPAFTKTKVTIRNKPVKLKLKNLPKNATVSYKSLNTSVVKMNPEGFAAPVSNGTAAVTARVGNVTAECTVTVKGLK